MQVGLYLILALLLVWQTVRSSVCMSYDTETLFDPAAVCYITLTSTHTTQSISCLILSLTCMHEHTVFSSLCFVVKNIDNWFVWGELGFFVQCGSSAISSGLNALNTPNIYVNIKTHLVVNKNSVSCSEILLMKLQFFRNVQKICSHWWCNDFFVCWFIIFCNVSYCNLVMYEL